MHAINTMTKGTMRTLVLGLCAAASGLTAGCAGEPGGGEPQPKDVILRFRTFDIGSDDCEDIFSFGDFTVEMVVTIEPSGEVVFADSVFAELGSASFQATVQSIDLNRRAEFQLLPGEEFEVMIIATEDDPINATEPQPWSIVEIHRFDGVISESMSYTNGPGCFSDDRLDMRVVVNDPADPLVALTAE